MNTISSEAARRLFLGAQGLLADPTRKATPSTLAKLIDQMGFVQLDSINYVERAHHLTLGFTAANPTPACVSSWHSVTAQATMPVTSAPEPLACPAWNLCHELESN